MLSGVLTRTRKAEVPDKKAVREPRAIEVEWTSEERAYYDAVYAWYMRRARQMGTPPGFAMQMPLRLAASCIPASQRTLRAKQPDLFRQDIDDFDDAGSETLDGLEQFSPLITPVTVDTKYDRLLTELHRVRAAGLRQAMIFSFFRGTLGYLAERLSEHFSVRVMHGLVPPADREEIMKDFRAGKFDLLLLSEVGSEGLDFSCGSARRLASLTRLVVFASSRAMSGAMTRSATSCCTVTRPRIPVAESARAAWAAT